MIAEKAARIIAAEKQPEGVAVELIALVVSRGECSISVLGFCPLESILGSILLMVGAGLLFFIARLALGGLGSAINSLAATGDDGRTISSEQGRAGSLTDDVYAEMERRIGPARVAECRTVVNDLLPAWRRYGDLRGGDLPGRLYDFMDIVGEHLHRSESEILKGPAEELLLLSGLVALESGTHSRAEVGSAISLLRRGGAPQ